jgi:hypothetical protein
MPFPRTTEELYLWHLLNSIKNKDLCGQGWKMARPLWGLLWVRYGISAEQWGDAPLIPTFCYQIEKAAAAAFDKAGLTAFQKLIRARFAAIASGEQSGYAYRQWSDVLRAIYLAQRNIAAYVALAGQTGLTPQDCLALGTLLATRKPNERWRGSSAGLPSTGKVMSAPQPPTTSTASARVADQTTTCKTRYEMELDASRRVRRQLIKVSSVRRRGGAGPENVGKRRILRTAKWRRGLEGRLLSGYESETLENVLAPLGEGANSWAVQPASA